MNKISPFVGVLMLDTAFARLPGDAGATESYPFPTKINRVQGAGSLDVVHGAGPSDFLLSRFVNAAQELEAEGAVGLVSTCGFLVHSQKEIAASVGIPTVLSALSLYPSLRLAIGERPIGILTASERYLMNGTLQAADIPVEQVEIAGMDDCEAFTNAILTNKSEQPDHLESAKIEAFARRFDLGWFGTWAILTSEPMDRSSYLNLSHFLQTKMQK